MRDDPHISLVTVRRPLLREDQTVLQHPGPDVAERSFPHLPRRVRQVCILFLPPHSSLFTPAHILSPPSQDERGGATRAAVR